MSLNISSIEYRIVTRKCKLKKLKLNGCDESTMNDAPKQFRARLLPRSSFLFFVFFCFSCPLLMT